MRYETRQTIRILIRTALLSITIVLIFCLICTVMMLRSLWSGNDDDEEAAIAGESQAVLIGTQEQVKKEPNNPTAHEDLAKALENLGRYNDAVAEWKIALKLDPLRRQEYLQHVEQINQELSAGPSVIRN